MKYKTLFIKIILLIFIFSNTILNVAKASKQVFIVLKVDNKIVTNINIEEEYKYLIALNPDLKNLKKKDAINIAKNSFLREKIKENELLKYYQLNQQNNKYLDQTFVSLYQKIGLKNEIEFQKYLSNFDLTVADVKKKLEIEILWNRLIYEKFNNQVEIDLEKIKKKISSNKIQKNYLLSEIHLDIAESKNIEKTYSLIKKSISEIGFKNTAIKYSKSDTSKLGGSIGWLSENQLSESILKEINKLNIGEITKPINIPGGFLILKIDKKENKEISVNLDEELNKRVTQEKNRQLNQLSLIYYNKIKFITKIDEK